MRRTIASALFLSSLFLPAAAFASTPASDASALTHRVSTGITPPKLLSTLNVALPDQISEDTLPAGTQISVSFVVDQKGEPQNIQVTRGFNLLWNARVVDAVSRLHYRPASLDAQAIPMGMNLTVTLSR